MADDPKMEIVKAVAEAVPLKEAYVDAVQPAAREAGQALGQVTSIVNSALRPLRTIQQTWGLMFDRLDGWLAEKLKDVPPDDVREPPPTVAGGVVTGLLFAAEQPDLRELFVQLLATSMTASTQSLAHPAFAEFLKQMTPAEAKLVSALSRVGKVPYVLLRAHTRAPDVDYSYWKEPSQTESDSELDELFSPFLASGPWNQEERITLFDTRRPVGAPPLIPSFQNLARLGLVSLDEDHFLEKMGAYRTIARSAHVTAACAKMRESGRLPSLAKAIIITTEYGQQFMTACVSPRSPAA